MKDNKDTHCRPAPGAHRAPHRAAGILLASVILSTVCVPGEEPPAPQPNVEALVAQFGAEKAETRARAADGLGNLPAEAATAVPALAKALADEAWIIRTAAASALGKLRSLPEKSVPALVVALKEKASIADEEHSHRPETPDALLELAKEEDLEIRWRSLIALGRYVSGAGDRALGKTDLGLIGSALSSGLHHRERLIRDTAGDALGDLGSDLAVGYLASAAGRGGISARVSASLSLGRIAPQAGGDNCLRTWERSMRQAPEEVWQAYAELWWRQAEAEMAGMEVWSGEKPDLGWSSRAAAARALRAFGEAAQPAVPSLIDSLQDQSWLVRLSSLETLETLRLEPATHAAPVGQLLQDSERYVRRTAGRVLLKMGAPATIAACRAAFGHKSVGVRTTAAEVLAELGPAARPALPDAIAAMDAWSLAPDGWKSGDHNMAILLLLARCCEVAAAVGPTGADSVPAFIEVIRKNAQYCADKSRVRLRPYFAAAFGSMCRQGDGVEALMDVLEDENPNASLCAIQSLGEIGAKARAAVPTLVRMMEASRGGTVVIDALGKIGEGAVAAVPLLNSRLDALNHRDRESAAEALGRIGPGAGAAIPALVKATTDPVGDVRWYALRALAKVGPTSVEALSAIRRALHENRHAYIRSAAVEALLARGREEALPVLRDGLSATRWGTRVACAEGAGQLGEKAAALVPELRKALTDEDRDVRRAAAMALGKIGRPAGPAGEELEKALQDFHRSVRRAAAEALVAIGRTLPEGYDADKPVRR